MQHFEVILICFPQVFTKKKHISSQFILKSTFHKKGLSCNKFYVIKALADQVLLKVIEERKKTSMDQKIQPL